MVDEGRVVRLLRGISERTGRLRTAYKSEPHERGDLWLDGIKYLLVHQYSEVDDAIALTAWERLADFDSFVSQLSEWLAEQRE